MQGMVSEQVDGKENGKVQEKEEDQRRERKCKKVDGMEEGVGLREATGED